MYGFYRVRRNRALTGVLAGLADKFNIEVWLVRAIFMGVALFTRLGWIVVLLYVLASVYLPIKENMDAERFGTGPRKRKEAEKIDGNGFF